MKQVDFYLISNQVNDAKFKLASRLANKLHRLDQSALIVTNSHEDSEQLDKVMWSFSDTSFLPHEVLGADNASSKVMIAEHNSVTPAALETQYDVLINLGNEVPLFNHHFSRVAEIVEDSDAAKTSARQRYKSYQTEGFELKTHNIEL